MSLALNRRGLALAEVTSAEQAASPPPTTLRTLTITEAPISDSLLASVPRRMSWRGRFAPSPEDEAALARIAAAPDVHLHLRS